MSNKKKPVGIYIIPTGIGADIGGYGGDALPYAKKLSRYCEYLIVNPNVANAGAYYGMSDNMIYAEGLTIDSFMQGKINFDFSQKALDEIKIGVIFDKAAEKLPKYILNANILTIDAMRASVGINVNDYLLTDKPVGARIEMRDGISFGGIDNIEAMYNAVDKLILKGCNRIAICCALDEYTVSEEAKLAYEEGRGVDPIGGLEAIISHSIISKYNIMAVHAPLLPIELPENIDSIDPRVASEASSFTFLPSILYGLSRSPDIALKSKGNLSIEDIDFVVVPHNCFGNPVVLEALKRGIKVYSIKDNANNSQLRPEAYGELFKNVIYCDNHEELYRAVEGLD